MAVMKRTYEDALEWRSGSVESSSTFQAELTRALLNDGCCLIKAPTDASEHEALEQLANQEFPSQYWTRPRPEFAQAYLGGDENGSSMILKIDRFSERWPHGDEDLNAWTIWRLASSCMYTVAETCSLLGKVAEISLGFSSTGEPSQMMLRKQSLASTQAETEQETIAQHLDFRRHQRLCLMSFIKVDGTSVVALNPVQQVSGRSSFELLVTTGIILVFRQDIFNYCYRSSSEQDLVLQTWVLEATRAIQLSPAQSNEHDILSFLGSPDAKLPRSNDPNVVAAGGHLASCHGIDPTYNMFCSGCDCSTEIPLLRWDHAPYYDEDESRGLALAKHLSLIDTYEMDTFDNEFWNLDREHVQVLYRPKLKSLEVAYEVLYQAGFNRQTLQSANISLGMGATYFSEMWALHTPTSDHCPHHLFISFHLGLIGKCFHTDTACSASMNTAHELHRDMMIRRDGRDHGISGCEYGHFDKALNVGMNCIGDPTWLIGGTQSHMMGRSGRCSTFDESANGYGGGESITAYYFHMKDAEWDVKQSVCSWNVTISGTAAGNDGRSASLTAPNGPAQTACFLQACQNSGMRPGEQVFHEYHGNGTKLGDAIEYGSVKRFFLGDSKPIRGPLGQGAFKTFTAHPAHAAGTTSMIKNMMCIMHGLISPNIHLREINQNMDQSGYPHFIGTEHLEYHYASVYLGKVGMGFGGTNARVDLMGTCTKGVRSVLGMASLPSGDVTFTIQTPLRRKPVEINDLPYVLVSCQECSGDMCFRCCQAFTDTADYSQEHQCSHVREPLARYDCCSICYKGRYLGDDVPKVNQLVNFAGSIHIVGSWSGWSDMQLMEEKIDEHGDMCYFQNITLDDAGRAEFCFVLDGSSDKTIYPVVEHAGPEVQIAGPNKFHKGRSWLIDGSSSGIPAGTTYRIKFLWDYDRRAIEWSPL